MTGLSLVRRSLLFHWRAHLGVLLGATVGTAILVGALAVGDSVRYSLREMALSRLGSTNLALVGGSRFFRAELADQIAAELKTPVAPIILLNGTATGRKQSGGEDIRAGRVQVVGVDERFWSLATTTGPNAKRQTPNASDGIILSDRLAAKLGVGPGDEVLIRVDKPSLISRDAPLSTVNDSAISLTLQVERIVTDS